MWAKNQAQICRLRTVKGLAVVPLVVGILADRLAFRAINGPTVAARVAVGGEPHAALHERRRAGAEGVDVGEVVPDAPRRRVEVELELRDGALQLGRAVEEFDGD